MDRGVLKMMNKYIFCGDAVFVLVQDGKEVRQFTKYIRWHEQN